MSRRLRLLLCVALLCAAGVSKAHPLGNDTVNRAAQLEVDGDRLRIDYRLDLAEVPTLLAAQRADQDGDGEVSATEWQRDAEAWARALPAQLTLEVDGAPAKLTAGPPRWSLVAGAAGLSQLRLAVELVTVDAWRGEHRLVYSDGARPDEPGWREIWAEARRGAALVQGDVARRDRSAGLTRFPTTAAAWPRDTRATLLARFVPTAATERMNTTSPAPGPAVDTRAVRGPAAMFGLGVHHIATGWDHLVFLLGLTLLARRGRDLLAVVTAFTVAHSLTLGLAAADLVRPPAAWVEPAIALSVAWVGVLCLLGRRGHGLPLAFGFGLVHGFGFAGALADSFAGATLGGHGWLLSLAAFNLGIEAFQLLLLAALAPLLAWGSRRAGALVARRCAAHGVLWSGVGWLVARLAGA